MSRQSHRVTPIRKKSASEPSELERATAALQEQFLAQFRSLRDSGALHFYKEMGLDDRRFRVMWFCKASQSGPKFDEDDTYATLVLRNQFEEHLDRSCNDLAQLMEWFVDNLQRMRHDLNWIERRAGDVWTLLDDEYSIWVQMACDGNPSGKDWRAPGWIDKWPAGLPPDARLPDQRFDCGKR